MVLHHFIKPGLHGFVLVCKRMEDRAMSSYGYVTCAGGMLKFEVQTRPRVCPTPKPCSLCVFPILFIYFLYITYCFFSVFICSVVKNVEYFHRYMHVCFFLLHKPSPSTLSMYTLTVCAFPTAPPPPRRHPPPHDNRYRRHRLPNRRPATRLQAPRRPPHRHHHCPPRSQ